MDTKGKTVWITGLSSGIRRGLVAEFFVRLGAHHSPGKADLKSQAGKNSKTHGAPLALLMMAAFAVLLSACRQREKLLNETTVFPALSGQKAFQLSAVEPGIRKIVVNFFAPDCPPCEKELPALKQFYQAHAADQDFLFISIGSSLKAVGTTDSLQAPSGAEIRSEISNFVRKFAVHYPQYVAAGSELSEWRVTGFPETFVFAREGTKWKLKRKFISEITRENLENELR